MQRHVQAGFTGVTGSTSPRSVRFMSNFVSEIRDLFSFEGYANSIIAIGNHTQGALVAVGSSPALTVVTGNVNI